MKNRHLIHITALCMIVLMMLAPVNVSAATMLKRGSKGSEVKNVQTTLKELGYYTYPKTTGYYGSATEIAVKRFQKAMGISMDGIIGKRTRDLLLGKLDVQKKTVDNLMAAPSDTALIKTATVGAVSGGALDWFKEVRYIWNKGDNAVITDVDTGLSFAVKRTYGSNHADVEPLTSEDTEIIKSIWGGFSWKRRAVVVKVGDYNLAASMSAMPHAGVDSAPADKFVRGRSTGYGWGANLDAVKNNGASGVMDVHFKNSRTHSTNIVQKSMQEMVEKAENYITYLAYQAR